MKRRDITLGEMQDECKKHDSERIIVNGECVVKKCEMERVCPYKTLRSFSFTDLTDPPRFTEAQMAFFKPWRDIGAKWASRDSGDPFCHEITFYNKQQQIIGYMVQTQIANGMPMQERIYLAELLGKDGAE